MTATFTLLAGRVATMSDDGVLEDQAIEIADGRIVSLSDRETAVLASRVVDWRDRTVVPALADMHSHVSERADMLSNLAHGVTLLRNMWGNPWHLFWQKQVAAGREVGPHLVTTSPIVDGRGVTGTTFWPGSACVETAEQAHATVSRWAELGYAQVKAYNWLSHEALQALGDACAAAGISLVGHCPQDMTLQEAMGHGQTCFEHLTNYEYGALTPDSRQQLDTMLSSGVGRWHPDVAEARTGIDDARLRDLAAEVADRGVTSAATLIVLNRMFGEKDFDDPRLAWVPPAMIDFWRPENNIILRNLTPVDRNRIGTAAAERTGRVLGALRDAGARVLVGTDAPNPFVFQGSSVVEEMELLVAAGYSPAEVLRMATLDAADFLGLADRGRIGVGAVADLVGVIGDPVSSPAALRDPAGVIVAGQVLERRDLDRLLDEAREMLAAPADGELPALQADEELVGDYSRASFGRPAGRVRVSCCSPAAGLQRWTETSIDRDRVESRCTVIDGAGFVVEAQVDRVHGGSRDSATVRLSEDGASYELSVAHLDGSTTRGTMAGPMLPSHDLGAPALLAALALTDGQDLQALTLRDALDNGLIPEPVPVVRDGDGHVLQSKSSHIRVTGGDDLATYEVAEPTDVLTFTRQ